MIAASSRSQVSRLYTTQSGLSSSAIYNVHFDSKGMAWVTGIATFEMFDGIKFSNILKQHKDLARAIVVDVFEYKNDKYWLITSNGLQLYDHRTNSLKHIKLIDGESDSGIPLNRMINYPKDGYVIISTSGYGLYVFDMTRQRVDSKLTGRITKHIKDRLFREIFIDNDGYLWGSSFVNNLLCFDLKHMIKREIAMTPEAKMVLNNNNINQYVQLRHSHDILIATNAGVLVYDHKQQRIRTLKVKNDLVMPVASIIETRDGKVIVGTDSRGIWQINKDESMVPYSIADAYVDLSYAKVRSIAEDSEGNLLVGIYQKGVLVVPNSEGNFVYHAISPTSKRFNSSCITSIAVDKHGNYWIGADGCGIFRIKKFEDSGNQGLMDSRVNVGLRSLLIQSIIIDKEGKVWTGSFGGGVQCLQSNMFVTPDWMQVLKDQFVMHMAYDKKHNILYVGTNGRGIFMVNLTKKIITNLAYAGNFNAWINSMYCDDSGKLWFGTTSGTYMFNSETNMLIEVRYEQSVSQSTQCFAINGNSVLIGTNAGLLEYDIRTAKSTNILQDESVMSIETTESDIWIATSRGIIRIDKKTQTPHTYTSFGGYFIGEFHKGACYQSSSGNIFFGADNGIISFNSKHFKQSKRLNSNLILTSLKVNGYDEFYDENKDNNVLDSDLFAATEINTPSNRNTLAFTFCVPNFSSPYRIIYKYKLEGYDNDWHTASLSHEAYYSSLPPGSYTFRIQAYYENNEKDVLEKCIAINIAYPWYESWWAWIVYIFLITLILIYIYFTYRDKMSQKQLLEKAHQNESIKEAKLRMFTSITHELRSPLTMIVSPLRQLITDKYDYSGKEKVNVISEEDKQSLYKVMKLNCDRLLNIVKQVTDIRKIDSGQFHMHFSEVDFYEYSDNIFKSFLGYAVTKHISFVIEHTNHNVQIWLDTVHFEKILTNLLSNAFKFTPNDGRVRVRTRCILKNAKDWFEVRVYNSGSHIDPKDIPYVFERFYQDKHSIEENMGSGIGLNLVTEIVSLHHGTIEVHNVDPDGVEFVMQFPLGSSHLSEDELLADEDKPNIMAEELLFVEVEGTPESEDETESSETKKKTLLVVDDDKNLCQYIKAQLMHTYNIMVAYSGNTAWQQILTQRPDAIVTDIRMPDGDGIELCKRIKTNPDTNNLPIIMLTSEDSDRTKIFSLNLDVDHFLSKPFNLFMLQGAIAHGIRVRERIMSRVRRTEVGFDYNATTINSCSEEKLFSNIIKALKAHIDDSQFGVNELASEVGVSRTHLNRKLKERYGMSPNNFIRSYRLKQAAYLLVNNNVSVSDVAYRMGFSSHPYFSNVFHDYFGMSPKEFIAYYADNANDETLQKLLE